MYTLLSLFIYMYIYIFVYIVGLPRPGITMETIGRILDSVQGALQEPHISPINANKAFKL